MVRIQGSDISIGNCEGEGEGEEEREGERKRWGKGRVRERLSKGPKTLFTSMGFDRVCSSYTKVLTHLNAFAHSEL